MNVEIAFAYLNGNTVQVKGALSWPEWVDVPAYRIPTDIYRISNKIYQFRVKPAVTERDALLVAGEVMGNHLFELATKKRMAKMNADLKKRLGSDEYEFVIGETGNLFLSHK